MFQEKDSTLPMVSFGEKVFQALFEPVAKPVVVLRGSSIQYLNEAAARLLGADPAAAIGRPLEDFLRPENEEPLVSGDAPARRARLLRDDGSSIALDLEAQPLEIGSERLVQLTLVEEHESGDEARAAAAAAGEASEPRRAGAARAAAPTGAQDGDANRESDLQVLARLLPDHFLRIDAAGRVLDQAVAQGEALALPAIGERIEELLPTESRAALAEAIASAIESGRVRTLEYAQPVAGATHHFEVRLVPCAEDRLIAILRDTTDRKRVDEDLLVARKLESIERLAGGVAHDFNNLLTAIVAHGELARFDLPAEGSAQDHLTRILLAAERAAELTRKLLAFSRSHVVEVTRVDLREVAREMLAALEPSLGDDIAVRFLDHAGENDAWVIGDVRFLEQAIFNVILNAREAMSEGGTLVIALRAVKVGPVAVARHCGLHVGDYLVLAVRDTGSGMDEETLGRAFDPFFTTKRAGEGRGLGLPTAHGIVKQLGGHIVALSRRGRGTTIAIYLPHAQRGEGKPVAPRTEHDGKGRVLLVEDEPAVREIVARVLRNLGYRVAVADDGALAERLAESEGHPYDVLVTDVVMPHIGGRELALRLRQRKPGLRVLFMSGYTQSALDPADLTEPLTAFLQKPFAPADLARELRVLLAEPA